jgi:hypothetical protein
MSPYTVLKHYVPKSAKTFIKEHIGYLPVLMSREEIACYIKYLDEAQNVVEYGVGGSTLLAARKHKHIVCVESDYEWICKLKKYRHIRRAEYENRLRFVLADLGPTTGLGYPKSERLRANWPSYANIPWQYSKHTDLVLIDGRFRLACIAATILHTKPQTIIAVHDFWNRPRYHPALDILEIVDKVDTLGIFRALSEVSRTEVRSFFARYAYTPE